MQSTQDGDDQGNDHLHFGNIGRVAKGVAALSPLQESLPIQAFQSGLDGA